MRVFVPVIALVSLKFRWSPLVLRGSMFATHSYATHSYVVNVLPSQVAKYDFQSFNAEFSRFRSVPIIFQVWSCLLERGCQRSRLCWSGRCLGGCRKKLFEHILKHIEVFLWEILICAQFCLKSLEIDWVARFSHVFTYNVGYWLV